MFHHSTSGGRILSFRGRNLAVVSTPMLMRTLVLLAPFVGATQPVLPELEEIMDETRKSGPGPCATAADCPRDLYYRLRVADAYLTDGSKAGPQSGMLWAIADMHGQIDTMEWYVSQLEGSDSAGGKDISGYRGPSASDDGRDGYEGPMKKPSARKLADAQENDGVEEEDRTKTCNPVALGDCARAVFRLAGHVAEQSSFRRMDMGYLGYRLDKLTRRLARIAADDDNDSGPGLEKDSDDGGRGRGGRGGPRGRGTSSSPEGRGGPGRGRGGTASSPDEGPMRDDSSSGRDGVGFKKDYDEKD